MSLVDLGKRLLEAAKQGLTDEVRTLMSNGAPFTTDWLGTSPLHFAAQHGHMGTAEVLLRAGISRDARTKVDRTPLHVAAQEGHQDVVDLLIKSGADIEAKDMLKMTPLHWSVEKGHVGVIELLLGHGADIHIDNKFDKSPVEIAISNGRSDLAELLQLSRMSQQNVVEVTTDPPVVEDIGETATIMGMEHATDEEEVISTGPIHITPSLKGRGLRQIDASGDGTEQSSTAVLATLAALAEATGPLNASNAANTTAAEALSWLESHGITMISSDTPTSLVESGETLSLTEAGKLALDLVKQKVITVSTDQGELTTEAGTPMVIRINSSGEAVAEPVSETDEPMLKRIKLEQNETGNIVATTDTVSSLNASYVFTKVEPQDSLSDDITTETIVSEGLHSETVAEDGVAVEGGMMITEDGHIVTQEGLVVHEGYGITVQSDLDGSQGVQIEEGYHIVESEEGIQVPEGYCITGHAELVTEEDVETEQGISSEEIQNFEDHQVVAEEELDGDNIAQEIVEGTVEDADAEEFRNRLDEITSKT